MLIPERLLRGRDQDLLVPGWKRLPRQAEDRDRCCKSGEGRVAESCR